MELPSLKGHLLSSGLRLIHALPLSDPLLGYPSSVLKTIITCIYIFPFTRIKIQEFCGPE
jgi:hypothetical protein